MIGICGMGGVGKTTMVKEIIVRLAKLDLFDKIVMATVSQSPSTRMIQSEIADKIGLKFEEESEPGRALKRHGRLMEIRRILIVLDDVWTEPDFEAIGLPSGDVHKGCKVLLTSRDWEVCNRMGSQQTIAELFREMVGESFNDPDLRSTAKDVVKECGGLPIAIVTVGKALEKKTKHEWDDALNQLRNSNPVDSKVYSSTNRSYDRLESDEAKSCILRCCLFPEDYDIPIEYLVRYRWDTRNRVHSLVDQLQMHDIVRDVAILIASRDPHGFLIRSHAGWPNLPTYDHYTRFSLVGELEIQDGLKCPKLELLQMMEGCFSDGSMDITCKAMKEVKVLALVEMEDPGSLESLGLLKNLRTLCLDGSAFDGMSTDVIGSLKNLEILSFRDCYPCETMPRVEHQSAGMFEKAIFPSKCISWLPSLEEVQLKFMKFEGMLFDLKIHIVADGQIAPTFPQLPKLKILYWTSPAEAGLCVITRKPKLEPGLGVGGRSPTICAGSQQAASCAEIGLSGPGLQAHVRGQAHHASGVRVWAGLVQGFRIV
ncbi:disease resistance protein [Pyrus ussuriensis x Pyrus communis]|uniref:Disease resistance protein n=1 Tax=Pyrus ussuriensis x Pyrus communis TaxID=2448454 RepID=A0A5N5GSP3_9ROSA|nr:disease resistance protein [Pyrus ussuriensis x Pyrus communis]